MYKYLDPELAKLHDLYNKHELVYTEVYSRYSFGNGTRNGSLHHCKACGMFLVKTDDPDRPLVHMYRSTHYAPIGYLRENLENYKEYLNYIGAKYMESKHA